MREIVCSSCGKMWICIEKRGIPPSLCEQDCDSLCAECYAKKVGARLELVREMNPNCFPSGFRVINPSRRKG